MKHLHLVTKPYISKENSTKEVYDTFIAGYMNIHSDNRLFLSSCIHMQYDNKVKKSIKKMVIGMYMSCISKTACFSVNCASLSLQYGRSKEPKRLKAASSVRAR